MNNNHIEYWRDEERERERAIERERVRERDGLVLLHSRKGRSFQERNLIHFLSTVLHNSTRISDDLCYSRVFDAIILSTT